MGLSLDSLKLGVCYYPEHWPCNLWEDDFRRMREHGLYAVRMAEFAWNLMEPEEGVFTIGWFDRAMDLAHENGLKVILGTPTATPPAWLTEKYPEVLNADVQGVKFRHGVRRHYNYNAPIYRDFCARIVGKMADHYQAHPALWGWQIDNELNCEVDVFYSDADHAAFREFLRKKYGTLDRLNDAWGAAFWNQTYTAWEQVYLTRPAPHIAPNPHLALDEKRFISESAISFCKLQADIIRPTLKEGQFITTNGLFGNLDSHRMTREALNVITYDSYPNFAYNLGTDPKHDKHLNDRGYSMKLALARSISPGFGVMEQQAGPGGWTCRMAGPSPKPGQMRLWALQSFAHGADFVSFFRWRTAAFGTEIYWHGLNNYDNLPNRRLGELQKLSGELANIEHLAGSKVAAKVALVCDYDNLWDGGLDQWHGPLRRESEKGIYTAAQLAHIPLDILYLQPTTSLEELSRYEILFYPHATILTEKTCALLKAYCEAGGKLVFGARTGYKDERGHCPMRPMPGPAAELVGATVEDFTFIGPNDAPEHALWDGELMEAAQFNDILAPHGGETLARFKGNYYDGKPALVRKALGKGEALYFGAGFSAQAAGIFLRKLGAKQPLDDMLALPEGIELVVREQNGKAYAFLLNYLPDAQEFTAKRPAKDVLSGEAVDGKTMLLGYGVMVLC